MKSFVFLILSFVLVALPGRSVILTAQKFSCTSSVSGITSTINFDNSATDPLGIAQYQTSTFSTVGGTNPGCGGGFLLLDKDQILTITFSQPVDYFGFAWGTPDHYNFVRLFNGSTQVGDTYSGLNVTNNRREGTSFVNFFAEPGEQFTSVRLVSTPDRWFESDNHVYRLAGGVTNSPIPEPSSFGLLVVPAALFAFRRKLSCI
ncbi:MAG: hypothetical protein K7J46_15845 [Bryobacter sp.]|jgi:hypothetical protein|nr:hypothetical protein [Bryobacter sp. CoA8 C33]